MVIWKEVAVILLAHRLNGDSVCCMMPMQNVLTADGLAIYTLNRGALNRIVHNGVKKLEYRE